MSWKDEFAEICKKTHSQQGIWFLNGFWKEGAEQDAEKVWTIVHQFIECQIDGPVLYGSKKQEFKEDGDLDEFKSHRILELMGETLTVVELRKRLKALDLDNNNRMAISEYLLDKFKKTPQALVNAPQGEVDPVKLAEAEAACEAASAALAQAADESAAAEKAQTAADAALEASKAAEAEVVAAEAALKAAVDEIEALEKAKEDKIAKCQKIIDDPSAGAVKKGKAVQDKESTLAEDPLPLRKAKITQGASLKRTGKARVKAEEESAKSKAAAEAAAQAKLDADAAQKAAEEALAAVNVALEDLKKKGGAPLGQFWWMERVLKEKAKFTKKR